MFSLIITIISIALVAALALATLYYGGDAFKRGASSASAAKLYTQAQQLQGAAELYKADTGAYPLTMEAMLTGNYLKSIPVAQLPGAPVDAGLGVAHAVDVSWAMVAPGEPVFALAPVTYAVCAALNNLAYKREAVLQSARSTLPVQCFGTDEGSLTVVTAKTAQALVASAAVATPGVALGAVLTAAIPADLADTTAGTGWLARTSGTAVVVPPVVPPVVQAAQVQLEDGASAGLTNLAFPDTSVGSNAAAQAVVVRNTGTADLVFTGEGVTVPSPFSLASNTCAGATVAPAQTCTVTVTFSPTAGQAFSGALGLTSNAAGPSSLALTGTGTQVGVTSVSVGAGFTLVLKSDGTVWGTGRNVEGQLGDGTNVSRSSFVQASTLLQPATAISAGNRYAVVIAGGTVWGTGQNTAGQLGDGSLANRNGYVAAQGITGTPSIVAAGVDATAVIAGGSVQTTGNNARGQLGSSFDSMMLPRRSIFGPVVGITGTATGVTMGASHVAAIAGGSVWGTGRNDAGQLGDGTLIGRNSFVLSQGLVGAVTAFDAGGQHTAVIAGGVLQVTGSNALGQLGTGAMGQDRNTFGPVSGLIGTPTAVSASGGQTVVIAGGSVQITGYSTFGSLADGGVATSDRNAFGPVLGVTGAPTAISSGDQHNAVIAGGSLQVVGGNSSGQFGLPSPAASNVFVPAGSF